MLASGEITRRLADCSRPGPGRGFADLDADDDDDEADFAVFQNCFSGADVLADPNCAG